MLFVSENDFDILASGKVVIKYPYLDGLSRKGKGRGNRSSMSSMEKGGFLRGRIFRFSGGREVYSGREMPLKILQFFKDLIKNERKNKSKLKVKWNVTAKQKKDND